MTELVSVETVRNDIDGDGDVESLSNAAAARAHLGNAAAGAARGFDGPAALARTQHGDQVLAAAVAEHAGQPNERSQTGVRWAQIYRSAVAGQYGAALQRRVTSGSSKALVKRWRRLHMA